MNTLSTLQEIIAANLGIPNSSVHPESRSSDFSEWNSVNHLLLIMEIERKFGLTFALGEISELDSVDKIFKRVEARSAR